MARHLRLAGSGEEPPEPPRTKGTTNHERQRLLNLVEQLMLDGQREDQILEIIDRARISPNPKIGPIPKCTRGGLKKLMTHVEQLWSDDARKSRQENRQRAINRNLRHMREARAAGQWNSVRGFEENLAKLQGLYAPEHLSVSLQQGINLSKILGDYDDEALSRMAEARDETERLAELYRASLDRLGDENPNREEAKPQAEPVSSNLLLPPKLG